MEGFVPDGVCARHIAYSIKQAGECLLQGDDVLGLLQWMGCGISVLIWAL